MAYMVRGSAKARHLRLQLTISNIIRFYAFMVIIANVVVLAISSHIEKSPSLAGLNRWLPIIGLRASPFEY
jgi:hypothetical protein